MNWRRLGWLGVLWLVACGPGKESAPAPAAESGPREGGSVVIALDADPRTLNPARMSTAQAARVYALLQPPLVRLDPQSGEWMPALATAWRIEGEGTRLVVRLDTTRRWSDGEAFDAEDVVATFDLYRDPVVAHPQLARLQSITSVRADDAATVRFEFASAPSDPLAQITYDILPAHLIASLDRSDPASWSIGRMPVTLGAYHLASWQQDDRLVLERNPHHPGPVGRLDRIEIVVVPDAAVRSLRLRTGEVDVVAAVPVTHATELAHDAHVQIVEVLGRSVAFLQYDLDDPLLSDVRVRRAIDLAIDREAIVNGVFAGHARPAASFLPPVSWAHDASLEASAWDPAAARALLAEAGFEPRTIGPSVRGDQELRVRMLTVAGDPVREAVAALLRAQLAEVGFDVDLRPMELASLMRVAQSDEFQMMLAQVSGPIDADVRPFFGTGGRFNFGGHADSGFDAWANTAVDASDRTVAIEAARRLQAHMLENQVITCLYYPATLVAHGKRVHGVQPNWLSPFDGFEQWWVDDAPAD